MEFWGKVFLKKQMILVFRLVIFVGEARAFCLGTLPTFRGATGLYGVIHPFIQTDTLRNVWLWLELF